MGGSERDRQLWEQQTEAQLAREPLWGPYFERTWRNNLTELASLEASLSSVVAKRTHPGRPLHARAPPDASDASTCGTDPAHSRWQEVGHACPTCRRHTGLRGTSRKSPARSRRRAIRRRCGMSPRPRASTSSRRGMAPGRSTPGGRVLDSGGAIGWAVTEYNVDARSTFVFAFDRSALRVYRAGAFGPTTDARDGRLHRRRRSRRRRSFRGTTCGRSRRATGCCGSSCVNRS